MEELENEIKKLIVSALSLEDVSSAEIASSDPLFGTGLGLDSIDALELAMALSKEYGIKIAADDSENHKIFYSVRSLAEFINQARTCEQTA